MWNQTPFVTDEEKSGSSTLQKRRCYPFRIFLATMRAFTKCTALSEQGSGAAQHVWINARHGRGTAWARHRNGMPCVNRPLNISTDRLHNWIFWSPRFNCRCSTPQPVWTCLTGTGQWCGVTSLHRTALQKFEDFEFCKNKKFSTTITQSNAGAI